MSDPVVDVATGGGGWLGYLAAAAGAVATAIGGIRYVRSSASNQAVTDASNEANISAIDTYKELVATERAARKLAEERADKFAEERNSANSELYKTLGKLEAMQEQLATVTKELEDLRAEVAKLRQGQQQ